MMMKKTIIGLLLFLALSCKKQESIETSAIDLTKTSKEVKFIADPNVQKTAFELLSIKEKNNLWIDHLQSYLETSRFNEQQLNLIKQTINFLSANNVFINRRDIPQELIIIDYKAKQLFSLGQRVQLFASLTPPKNHTARDGDGGPDDDLDPNPDGGLNSSNCTCSRVSDYCYYNCASTGCVKKSNCGTFWSYDCDGRCKNPDGTTY